MAPLQLTLQRANAPAELVCDVFDARDIHAQDVPLHASLYILGATVRLQQQHETPRIVRDGSCNQVVDDLYDASAPVARRRRV
jgi:hypothetical protein